MSFPQILGMAAKSTPIIYCSRKGLKWMLLIQEARVVLAVRILQHKPEIREFFPGDPRTQEGPAAITALSAPSLSWAGGW